MGTTAQNYNYEDVVQAQLFYVGLTHSLVDTELVGIDKFFSPLYCLGYFTGVISQNPSSCLLPIKRWKAASRWNPILSRLFFYIADRSVRRNMVFAMIFFY